MLKCASPVSGTDPEPPLVSVIVPAYNSARTIARCMRALADQETAHRFEVIVVHSGEDDTCTTARRVLPSVRALQLQARAIPPRARHVGIQHARGTIFAFLDSDIYAHPTWLDHVVKAADTGYDLICGSIENANPQSAVSRAEQLLMFNEFMPDQPEHPSWFALSGNTVLRRTTYERFGPFAEVRAAEDVVFSRKLMAAGGRILFYPALRVHHENRTQLWTFLRNQCLVGRHTAIARRLVHFADSPSFALFVLSLPIAPLVKLAKVVIHLGRHDPWQARSVIKEFPLLFTGICAYCLGMVGGVVRRSSEGSEPPVGQPSYGDGQSGIALTAVDIQKNKTRAAS